MKKLIVANHKMNLDAKKINVYIKLMQSKANYSNVLVCPTSIYVPFFLKNKFKVGIQNVYFKNEGAYTGEISAHQAKSVGVSAVIIGHSERREHFNETNEIINKKIISVIDNGLSVILCVGEKETSKKKLKFIEKQLTEALDNVHNLDKLVVAYEPVWSIGTNITPTNEEIIESVDLIKSILKDKYGYQNIPVLYGGSVNKENISTLEKISVIDGYLIGGASLKDEFFEIVEFINNNYENSSSN